MSEKQKRDLIIGIIAAAMLPMEVESELIDYVKSRRPEGASLNNFATGAEFMHNLAVHKIMELEDGCLGVQKAALAAARKAVEHLEIVGMG